MSKPLTKTEREQLLTYIRTHHIEVDDKGSVTMNGCYLTLANDKETVDMSFSKDERDNAIPVGNSPDGREWFVRYSMGGELRLLFRNDVDEVCSYGQFEPGSNSRVACIGISRSNCGWIGWTHRGCFLYKVGHVVKEGDIVTKSGWIESYEKEHPERGFNVEPGFVCKTLDDCKRCAIAHAMALS